LPMLASMLFYIACEKNDAILDENSVNNKELYNQSKMPTLMLKEVAVGRKHEVMEVSVNDKLSAAVRTFVARNFNAEMSKTLNLKDNKFKIYSVFTVNANGEIENVRVRAPHPKLKKETERVLAMLPKLSPVNKDGKSVAMKYTLPISYNTNSLKSTFKKFNSANDTDVPFVVIEEVPVYPGCVGTREQKAKCLNKGIKKVFAKNFNADLSKSIDLSKGKKKVFVIFRIDENGDVVDVNARAPHPKLREEAERVAALLPKMKAGKQRGKAVGMKYTLPISFNVE
jgi:bla regulator protein BlaR1